MALPKINHPVFNLSVPSMKREFKFRPFLVKEEKLLLMAQTSGDPKEIILSIKQVINNCVQEDLDIDQMTTFDIEYLFIKLRAKSVNNIIEINYTDPEDENRYKIEIDLNDIEIKETPGHTNKIDISKNLGMMLKYPKIDLMNSVSDVDDETQIFFDILKYSIDTIYDNDKVYKASDYTLEEIDEFIQSLNVAALKKTQDFFATMPKLHYVTTYKTQDGVEKELVLSNLNDFFTLG
jgi:hypothetical protein